MQDEQQEGQNSTQPGVVLGPPNAGQPIASPVLPQQQMSANPAQQSVASSVEVRPVQSSAVEAPVPAVADPYPVQEDLSSQPPAPDFNAPHVEWTASEYLANPKSGGWFMLLALASIGTGVAVYFITGGSIVSSAVIVLTGLMFGIFSARQPEVLDYAIDNTGFHVGKRFYPYGSFKSFSVIHEGALGSISLMPLKRFMPPLVIHYDPNDEDKIANTLSNYLPYEEHKPDIVDSISRRLKF